MAKESSNKERRAGGSTKVFGLKSKTTREERQETMTTLPTEEPNDPCITEEGRNDVADPVSPPPNQRGSRCSVEDTDEGPSTRDGKNAASPGKENAGRSKMTDAKGRKGKGPEDADAINDASASSSSSSNGGAESDASLDGNNNDDAGEILEANMPKTTGGAKGGNGKRSTNAGDDDASASSSYNDSDGNDGGDILETRRRSRGRGQRGLWDADARREAIDAEARRMAPRCQRRRRRTTVMARGEQLRR